MTSKSQCDVKATVTAAATSASAASASASASTRVKTVAVVVFPGFTVLDVYGPVQAFAMAGHKRQPATPAAAPAAAAPSAAGAGAAAAAAVAGLTGANATIAAPLRPATAAFDNCYRIYTVGAALPWTNALGDSGAGGWGPVPSFEGPATHATYRLADVPFLRPDVLLVPGGFGTRALVHDTQFLAELRAACNAARITATVCTGSALVAATGLLDGVAATSNKLSWAWVCGVRPQVLWRQRARWVSHVHGTDTDTDTDAAGGARGVMTSSGVSAGIDMALDLIARLDGLDVAERSAQRMEYEWRNRTPDDDPFVHSKL